MTVYAYEGILSRQNANAPTLCTFVASADEILEWAAVERLDNLPKAPQRRFAPHKAIAIARFFNDPRNCIPTAVTVAVRPGKARIVSEGNTKCRVELDVDAGTPESAKPAIVIDGQHRLYGAKKTGRRIEFTVVALLEASDLESAFQFLVINHKASKVSGDHIRALAFEYDKDELEKRLTTAKLTQYPNLEYVAMADQSADSPFKGLLRWPTNRHGRQVIPPAAIEGAVALVQQNELDLFKDSDALSSFFFTIWSVVRRRWADVWEEACLDEGSATRKRLLDKIGIICITQYFTDALVQLADMSRIDLGDPDVIAETVDEMLDYQEKAFWQVEWVSASYDTKAGRAAVVDAMVRINRNLRRGAAWYEEIKLVDPGAIGDLVER
jgi:DGQHR domain-containing protein